MSDSREHQGERKLDRVSNFHVADLTDTHPLQTSLAHLLTLLSSRLSSSPPVMTVFPLAFVVFSLSLLVCAADLYEALQG